MSKNTLVTYKVAYLHPGISPRNIPLITSNKAGKITFVNEQGELIHRAPLEGEKPHSFNLLSVEPYEYNGKMEKRVFVNLTYESDDLKMQELPDYERAIHKLHKTAHAFIKEHQNVVVKDAENRNTNRFQVGIALFELIEESSRIKKQNEDNDLITKARTIANELFHDKPSEFVEFCYLYNIKPVEGVEIEKLYNEVLLKIQTYPKGFFDAYDHKQAELMTIIRKGEQKADETGKTYISTEGDFIVFDDEIIGQTDEEVLHYFSKNPKRLEYLRLKLGLGKKEETKVVRLPEVETPSIDANTKTINRARAAAEVNKMKLKVVTLFKNMEDDIREDPENKKTYQEKVVKQLYGKMKEDFSDLSEPYAVFVAQKLKDYKMMEFIQN